MSGLLAQPPFAPRDSAAFLNEMNALTRHHLAYCPEYARVWPGWADASRVEDLPYLHVGVFKRVLFRTAAPGLQHGRQLASSSTSGGTPSRIVLDPVSSAHQARSAQAIFSDFIGPDARPLLILDHVGSIQVGGALPARAAAALSLRPFATQIDFLAESPEAPDRIQWEKLACALKTSDSFLVYGLTWILWKAWAASNPPPEVAAALRKKRVVFLHSGGWKRLETERVTADRFESGLLSTVAAGSRVIDFYGLVEQVGVVFPNCPAGFRHVPRWADVLVRDPASMASLKEGEGLLQFLNVLAWGAPYHSVLTEDVGRLSDGDCSCGRAGKRFQLVGRLPQSELRGCGNV